jgi:hypothetical protein
MDSEVKIDGLPSVRVGARWSGHKGTIHLDPVYGSTRHQYEGDLAPGHEAELLCPRCGVSLLEAGIRCPTCAASVYVFHAPPRGMIQGCTRRGCGWQYWGAVEAEGYREYVEMTVSDTGSGISPDDLNKVFEPFYTTKEQRGTGLGLAVVWGIVDNHNGTIGIRTEVGKGTKFTIRLPIDHER